MPIDGFVWDSHKRLACVGRRSGTMLGDICIIRIGDLPDAIKRAQCSMEYRLDHLPPN